MGRDDYINGVGSSGDIQYSIPISPFLLHGPDGKPTEGDGVRMHRAVYCGEDRKPRPRPTSLGPIETGD